MVHILGQEKKQEGYFDRRTGHAIEVGAVVEYRLVGFQFAVLAHREGIEAKGQFPCVRRDGGLTLMNVIARAIRHHEYLATFPVGAPQRILPETVLDIEEQQGTLLKIDTPDDTSTPVQ
jgi:hypothetical protein